MEELTIRPAEERDIPNLYHLMTQYIVDFYKKPEPNEAELKNLILHLQEHPDSGLQFVAENQGEIVGFATLYYTFSTLQVKRAAILNDLFVSADARGQKAGEQLFAKCLAHIRENNFAYMTWETAKDNYVAQGLYNKMGGRQSEWLVYEIE
ncbi:GNAT family N-acetyltransferase [Mesobacillus selenatarsenatis]|uniref:Acetyltransferase, GNAT family n=1 Tax=Mesobacillus selenatarsenatis (strain DSM 18680 / JCM 14380 / FERM P-15431 / SF-1) TaxID=1321606 RepID=A0A0A8X7Z4_MESS1|nr:GNAT family N-acetyltransferase [Mesobacillus selenatarsenatis]GAM16038.1 acetyltransferase, GNAT family [Mesobacillus selenatarsenatis SF-1]